MYNQDQTVQIGQFPPITLGELRSAGIRWHPQTGLGAMPAHIPVSQEDRDRLGVVRNKKLRRLKTLAKVTVLVCLICVGFGLGAVFSSAPNYNFPHSMGGGCITAFVVGVYVIIVYGMVREGKKTPTGDVTTSCLRTLWYCNIFYMMFFASIGVVAIGMSGIWGTIDCAGRTPEDDDTTRFTINGCTPNTETLFAMAVMTLISGTIAICLFLYMNCIICANSRAFGIKSNYENFADYQILRMQQMQAMPQQVVGQYYVPPVQGQSVPQGQGLYGQPVQGQGQYGQPVPQGQYGQVPQGQGQFVPQQGFPQGYGPHPSAPLLPGNQPPNNKDDGAPPSYNDVMLKENTV